MKPSDFMPPDNEHTQLNCKPPMQADLDKLKAMYDLLMYNIPLARGGINSISVIDNDKTSTFGPLTITEIGPPAFYGIKMCPNCARLAVIGLRDAAQALEDIINFIDKPADPA